MEAVGSEKSQRNKIEQILSFPLKFLSTLVKSCQQESKQKLAEHIIIIFVILCPGHPTFPPTCVEHPSFLEAQDMQLHES